MTRFGFVSAALTISILGCGIGLTTPANAKVTKLEIASQQSYGTFKPGEYVWWQGTIRASAGPDDFGDRQHLVHPADDEPASGAFR